MIFSPSKAYLLLSLMAMAEVLLHCDAQKTSGRQDGMNEILQYDTTDADAVQFQCDPLDDSSRFNPRCNLDPSTCETWNCQGSASLTYCDSEFFVPGRTSDVRIEGMGCMPSTPIIFFDDAEWRISSITHSVALLLFVPTPRRSTNSSTALTITWRRVTLPVLA